MRQPRGLLIDYGGTLVEEVGADVRRGVQFMLDRAANRPPAATLDAVMRRVQQVTADVADRRDEFQIETPWTSLTRLIHDYFGTRFDEPLSELEIAYWDAVVTTRPMPGAREALARFPDIGLRMGVVCNASFRHETIEHELAKHGLTDHLQFVLTSAEYAVRKPHPLLFETAAARLGLDAEDLWFIGDSFQHDIVGAKASRMTAVWLRPSSVRERAGADLVVESWSEIVAAVQRAAE